MSDLDELRAQRDAAVGALAEALDGWEDCALYKGEYLREKHGDAYGIARGRATLALLTR